MSAEAILQVEAELSRALSSLSFAAPVHTVLDPLTYAWAPHAAYVRRYAGTGQVLLLGMNPGPWGMAQTGVPFGAVPFVRDFLRIEGDVESPANAHPKRPVAGFGCERVEVSGARFWGWAEGRFGTADAFFARFFVLSWCPLIFFEPSGRNRTPEQLPRAEQRALEASCDDALQRIVAALAPERCLGIGRLAAARLAAVHAPGVGVLPHPSPASPAANRGWSAAMDAALVAQGVVMPVRS